MAALSALLIVQLIDPIRIVAVLCVWYAWRSLEWRTFLLVLLLAVTSVLLALLLKQTRYTPTNLEWFAVQAATGFVANCIIAGAAYGITRLFKSKSKVATRR